MEYQDALEWLFQTQRFGIKLGLENVRRLISAAEISLAGPTRFMHVAGTNGKGSVCAFMDAICRKAGIRTGLFTSPHLIEFGERIRIDGQYIPHPEIAEGLTHLRNITKSWPVSPTFFEFTTILALRHFQEKIADVAILETGMGGRLDATNIVHPNVSVITPIGLDHQRWLGPALEDIAEEKAGIIKPGCPVISAPQDPQVASVLKKIAADRGSELTFVTEEYEGKISLRGRIQRFNAAVAAAAIRKANLNITERDIADGIACTEWRGRFQRVQPGVVVDGAHNAAAMKATASTWREEFGGIKATVILGVLADKEIKPILAELAGIADEIVTVPVRSPRTIAANELKELVSTVLPDVPTRSAENLDRALELALATRRPILIAGSLFLVGEALAKFEARPEELRCSLQ